VTTTTREIAAIEVGTSGAARVPGEIQVALQHIQPDPAGLPMPGRQHLAGFDATGITEVGRLIDQGGNDFWGVELTDKFRNAGRVVAFSDRDYGLYLASYTGP